MLLVFFNSKEKCGLVVAVALTLGEVEKEKIVGKGVRRLVV